MNEKTKTDLYVEHINKHIIPFIDYSKLQSSYKTDMVYAKGILNSLHTAMVEVYGSNYIDEYDSDGGYVVIPGVVEGKKAGDMAIALLTFDLLSSGEHCGTSFLCEHGAITQGEAIESPVVKKTVNALCPYNYCYTALIADDIHVNNDGLPEKLKEILADFQNHDVILSGNKLIQSNNLTNSDTGISEVYLSEQEFKKKIKELLPNANEKAIECFVTYANELDADEIRSKDALYSDVYVAYNLAAHKYGIDTTTQAFKINEKFCLNPWEILEATQLVKAGVSTDEIISKAVNEALDLHTDEFEAMELGLKALKAGTLKLPSSAENPVVPEKNYNEAKEPKKHKSRQKKRGQEL